MSVPENRASGWCVEILPERKAEPAGVPRGRGITPPADANEWPTVVDNAGISEGAGVVPGAGVEKPVTRSPQRGRTVQVGVALASRLAAGQWRSGLEATGAGVRK